MPDIRVAGAQIPVTKDIAANEREILRAIEFARAEKADILLTPEGSLSGYHHVFDQKAVNAALERVRAAARSAKLGLALGTCFIEPDDGKCYNELRFYGKDGGYMGFHSKQLRCGTVDAKGGLQGEITVYAAQGLNLFCFEATPIGGLICNDMWANPQCTVQADPNLCRELSRKGARIVFHAVNGGRDKSPWSQETSWNFHQSNLQMRALAGKVHIVTVDNAFPLDQPCAAPSGVIGPDGRWLCKTNPMGVQYFAHTVAEKATEKARG
jgi:predicted amidohydrolase